MLTSFTTRCQFSPPPHPLTTHTHYQQHPLYKVQAKSWPYKREQTYFVCNPQITLPGLFVVMFVVRQLPKFTYSVFHNQHTQKQSILHTCETHIINCEFTYPGVSCKKYRTFTYPGICIRPKVKSPGNIVRE